MLNSLSTERIEPPEPTAPVVSGTTELDTSRVHLHMPIDVRSVSLAVIAALAGVYALHWAAAVFIPLLLGLLLSYSLSPMVDRLQRWHVPRALGAH